MEINMTYAIIGTGIVGATLARFFAAKDIPVLPPAANAVWASLHQTEKTVR
jgi:predicted dinucleotide-binding enzyme